MPQARNLAEVGTRVEELLGQLRSVGEPGVAERAEELVRLLVELYGAGLERVVEILAEAPAGGDYLDRLAADQFLASLLVLHDLHPVPTEERIEQALDSVRPYLGSHAGGVEYLGLDDEGVVHLRLAGSCDGCPSSLVTVKLAIERAIVEAAPEVTAVSVEGLAEPGPAPSGSPVPVQIGQKPAAAPTVGGNGTGWAALPSLPSMPPGTLVVVEVEGNAVVVCSVGGELYAYRDTCPACSSDLGEGRLAGDLLTCPACTARYDVRRAGRGVDSAQTHLDPIPLLAIDGGVRVAVPVAVAP